MTAPHSQVLIAGAGPSGLALACRLLQMGVDVRLIEQKPGPSTTSKAIGLQYRVSEMLTIMGLRQRFESRSSSPTEVNIYGAGKRLVQLSFRDVGRAAGAGAFQPQAWIIPQSETEAILAERFRELGGQIEWNTALVACRQTAQRVESDLRLADGTVSTHDSDYLVSCEGAHSVVRKQAGIEFAGKTYDLLFLLADVDMDDTLPHAENHVWMHPAGTVAAMPLPGPRRWRWMVEVSDHQTQPLEDEAAVWHDVQQTIAARVPLWQHVTSKQPVWASQFRVHCRVASHFRNGRIFLAGDAAHIHSPTGGQGITTGMQDVMNLAWKLDRVLRGAPRELLDSYEQERRPHAEEVLRETDRTTTIFFATRGPMRVLRDWIVLPLLRQRWVQRRLFGRLAQLHVNYRNSRLAPAQRIRWNWRGGLQSGDRAPDVHFTRHDGVQPSALTLFDLLRLGKPLLLIGADPTRTTADRLERFVAAGRHADLGVYFVPPRRQSSAHYPATPLLDTHGDLRRIYGLGRDFLCLVRPDGYLGLVCDRLDPAALGDYLLMISPASIVEDLFGVETITARTTTTM